MYHHLICLHLMYYHLFACFSLFGHCLRAFNIMRCNLCMLFISATCNCACVVAVDLPRALSSPMGLNSL